MDDTPSSPVGMTEATPRCERTNAERPPAGDRLGKIIFFTRRLPPLRYGLAVMAVVVALALTLLFRPLAEQRGFLLFFVAVVLTTWRGGLGPGLLATGVSALALAYFFLAPIYSFAIAFADSLRLGVFVFLAVLVSSLQAAWRRAERQLASTEQEFRIAHQIQQRLFPAESPEVSGFDIAGACYPAAATGGDFFDYNVLPGDCVGIAVGDVSGHGFGPALLMAETHAYLHALALTEANVGEMLTLTNRLLCEDTEDERFVTLFYGHLNPRALSLVYASAGHEGYLLDAAGEVSKLPSTGLPLGIERNEAISCSFPIPLEADQLILLMTDGIIEAAGRDGNQFGAARALDVVRANRSRSAHEIVTALCNAAISWSEHLPPMDDMTVVVIKVGRATGGGLVGTEHEVVSANW